MSAAKGTGASHTLTPGTSPELQSMGTMEALSSEQVSPGRPPFQDGGQPLLAPHLVSRALPLRPHSTRCAWSAVLPQGSRSGPGNWEPNPTTSGTGPASPHLRGWHCAWCLSHTGTHVLLTHAHTCTHTCTVVPTGTPLEYSTLLPAGHSPSWAAPGCEQPSLGCPQAVPSAFRI